MQRQIAGGKPQRMARLPASCCAMRLGNIVQRIIAAHLAARFGYVGGLINHPGNI